MKPGPIKKPCGQCGNPVAINHRAVQCEDCFYWLHIGPKYANISPAEYGKLANSDKA
ncbi:hypothetical protein DPMN_172546 [Dreissena polymorpha]|uniref:Uncharacterized protein n=1 Tax=Dreissena polymorpha TaxID=45954 RepID=A0A9D4E2I5_DREPO|nr:hypothetical protein DPMN_172546 [Dreissena polymorpha]